MCQVEVCSDLGRGVCALWQMTVTGACRQGMRLSQARWKNTPHQFTLSTCRVRYEDLSHGASSSFLSFFPFRKINFSSYLLLFSSIRE